MISVERGRCRLALEETMAPVVVYLANSIPTTRRVTKEEGEALAKKLGGAFVESSAKDNMNVGESFISFSFRITLGTKTSAEFSFFP